MTPEKRLAKEYAEAINSAPNGWSQHVHPVTGARSDYIMRQLWDMVGEDECTRLIKQAMSPAHKG